MNYHNITCPDMNNGDGLRVVLWLSGCSHHCEGCQNQQTWDAKSGIKFDGNTKNELFKWLNQSYISGITLSGGDPLYNNNLEDVLKIINEIRISFPTKTIWVYSGYKWEDIFTEQLNRETKLRQSILKQCDVLVDGEYIDELRDVTLKWIGSSNQRVIDINQTLKKNEVVLHQ